MSQTTTVAVSGTNPQVAQGTLNRLRSSLVIPNFPSLNATASYLGRAGVSLGFEGNTTLFINTLTGAVTSPEPYLKASISIQLLKTQALSGLYKAQMESDSRLGQITVKSDATTLPDYVITNCAIETLRELSMNGEDPHFMITIGGYYMINNNLWNLV
jgi:hypothetical protein